MPCCGPHLPTSPLGRRVHGPRHGLSPFRLHKPVSWSRVEAGPAHQTPAGRGKRRAGIHTYRRGPRARRHRRSAHGRRAGGGRPDEPGRGGLVALRGRPQPLCCPDHHLHLRPLRGLGHDRRPCSRAGGDLPVEPVCGLDHHGHGALPRSLHRPAGSPEDLAGPGGRGHGPDDGGALVGQAGRLWPVGYGHHAAHHPDRPGFRLLGGAAQLPAHPCGGHASCAQGVRPGARLGQRLLGPRPRLHGLGLRPAGAGRLGLGAGRPPSSASTRPPTSTSASSPCSPPASSPSAPCPCSCSRRTRPRQGRPSSRPSGTERASSGRCWPPSGTTATRPSTS